MFFVSLRLLNVNSRLSVPCAIVLPIELIGKRQMCFTSSDFPSRLKHSSAGSYPAVMKPQVGEMSTSPAWSLVGQHGHLQVCNLRMSQGRICGGGHRWESRRSGVSLQLMCQVSAMPGFKPFVSCTQAPKMPTSWASQLIWDLSAGYSSASLCLMQVGTSSAAVT